MTIQRILFATDFSEASRRAQEMAASMKDQLGCHLDVIHVYDPTALMMPVPYGSMPGLGQWVDEHFTSFETNGRKALEELCPELGPGCQSEFIQGRPGPAIVDYATKNKIDLVIMGTHGHRGFDRLILGSVADYVVHHAPCPVISVKSNDD